MSGSIDPYFTIDAGQNWTIRDSGLPNAGIRYTIIDPFQHTLNDLNNTAVYACGVGYIAHSWNGGQNWNNLISDVPDPPNFYSGTPAPIAATGTYTLLSADNFALGVIFAPYEYYDSVDSKWRSWTLKRSGSGSWSWIDGLSAAQSVPSTWWETTGSTETAESLLTWPEDKIAQAVAVTDTGTSLQANGGGFSSNPTVAHLDLSSIGFPDDTVLTPATPLAVSFRVTFDYYKASFSTDYLRLEQGGSSNIRAQYQFTNNDGQSPGTWQSYDITFGGNIFTRYPDHPDGLLSSRNSLYLVFRLGNSGNQVKNFKWELLTSISGDGGESRQLGQDIDRYSATNLYKIEWNGSDIVLLKRLTSDLSIATQTTLGEATLTEINNRTYYAKVFCPATSADASTVYVFGRWNDGTEKHLVKSVDGGATLGANIGDSSWAGSYVSSFFAIDNTLMATIYNVSTGAASLWRSQDSGASWTRLLLLPTDFECSAMTLNPSGWLAMANRQESALQAILVEPPLYDRYYDISGGLGSLGRNSITFI